MILTDKQKSNFLKKFIQTSSNDCWGWTGAKFKKNGYGAFGINYKMKLAHRVSYEIFIEQIPTDLCVLHKCDNPLCVNPNHLFLGTHRDNMQDMVKKSRQGRKLTKDEIKEIKKSSLTQQLIASKFNVSQSLISFIKNNKQWKYIN
jgi:hypothetical protein